MTGGAGSLGPTQLLAYISDGESAASVRALMHRQNVKDFAVEPGTAIEATEYLRSHPSPRTLIVEVPSGDAAPRMLDALADVVHPGTRVIVTGKVDTFSFYHWLMGLGIHDYLLEPFNEQQLASALAKGTHAATAATAEPESSPKKLIAVIGARGGVGTTTIATALASILAKDHQHSTALVDADVQFGSVALGLDLEPSRGLRDALEKPDRIDTLFLERVMIKQDGLSILSAEENLSELVATNPQAGELLFGALREKFTTVVADLPRQITPLVRYVLASADHVVIVAEPSVLSLRDTLRLRELLVDVLKRTAPLVLINREGMASKQEPPRADFTRHLGASPAGYIPYAAEVIASTSRGDAITSDAKLSHVTAPLRALAAQFAGAEANPKTAKVSGLAGLLKGRK